MSICCQQLCCCGSIEQAFLANMRSKNLECDTQLNVQAIWKRISFESLHLWCCFVSFIWQGERKWFLLDHSDIESPTTSLSCEGGHQLCYIAMHTVLGCSSTLLSTVAETPKARSHTFPNRMARIGSIPDFKSDAILISLIKINIMMDNTVNEQLN